MTTWTYLLIVSLVVVFIIPWIAWNGKPRGFTRIHWCGLTVGAGLVGFILLFLSVAARDSEDQKSLVLPLLWGGATLIAAGIGSLVAVFFCRSSGSARTASGGSRNEA